MEHGDIVETGLPCGRGVIIDLAYGEALILLYEGSVFDTTHGRWFPLGQLVPVGHDGKTPVWRGAHRVPAGE